MTNASDARAFYEHDPAISALAARIGLTRDELLALIASPEPPRFVVDADYEPKHDENLVRRAVERVRALSRRTGRAFARIPELERVPNSASLKGDLRSAMINEHLRSDRTRRTAERLAKGGRRRIS